MDLIRQIRRITEEVDGWLSLKVATLLFRLAKKQSEKGTILEIGSYHGKSTLCLASALHDRPSSEKIIAIDPHTGSREHQGRGHIDTFAIMQSNIRQYGFENRIEILRQPSSQALPHIQNHISMAFIDGSHEYEDVLFDFQLCFDLLIPAGVLAFHDSNWPGVKKVLWEQVYLHPHIGLIRRVEQTTYFRKMNHRNLVIHWLNRMQLTSLKAYQFYKRWRRKLRKKLQSKALIDRS